MIPTNSGLTRCLYMKQITNKEYEEWQKYKAEKEKGTIYVTNAPTLANDVWFCREMT